MREMFYYCSNLTSLDVSNFYTYNVTSMKAMFQNCSSLSSLNVSKFNTSKVTDMGGMFSGCSGLTSLDVSKFDTSKVTNMRYMFSYCKSLTALDVSSFNTSKVTDMSAMFSSCIGLTSLDVSNFNTSMVTDMSAMFNGNYDSIMKLTEIRGLKNFNTSNVTSMSAMFSRCSSLTSLDVSNFDTSNVTDMSSMFYDCSGITSLDVSKFDTSKVTNMGAMFMDCSNLTSLDLGNFNTSNVTSMCQMFMGCQRLYSLYISNFDTGNVTNMSYMFSSCYSLTLLNLSNFDTSKVTNMYQMFYHCRSLTTTITIRGTLSTNYGDMFYYAATNSGTQITVNYTEDASSLVDNMIATKSSNSNVIKNATPEQKYSITLNATSDISLSTTGAYRFTDITINTSKEEYIVSSFKLNGTLIEGNTFKMPGENVTISDVVTVEATIVESEHNPYPNSIDNQEYLNKTWTGATSLTVVLEYQTESTNYDWIYLYDKNNTAYGKYGGTTLKTETITIPGDTLRIVFKTDSSGNNYYGFKATITPNYG